MRENGLKIKIFTDSKNMLHIRTIAMVATVGLLNSFYYENLSIMLVLAIVEIMILLYCMMRGDYLHYICAYMVFLCFSMESSNFVGTDTFYGFKNFRIAGLNLAVWMLLPVLLKALARIGRILPYIGSTHKEILKMLVYFTGIGFLMGFFTYIVNDNGFSNMTGSVSMLFNTYYGYILPFCEIIVVSYVVVRYSDDLDIVKRYLFSCIIVLAIVYIVCLITGNYGNRGGLASLQVSGIYFLLVCALALVVYPQFDRKAKLFLMIASVIILVLSLAYNTSGKIVIMVVLTPIVMIVIMAKRGSPVKMIITTFFVMVLLVIGLSVLLPYLRSTSKLFAIKFEQVSDMFSFGGNWLENMSSSPKMRITEFMNIGAEYLGKPWLMIFGKGFTGTIKDNLGLFDELTGFSFSEWELNLGAYFSMHESVNCFFLVGGLSGLWIILSISMKLLKRLERSPWLVLGFMWILLFYNYHMSIAIYGIVALIVGLQDLSIEEARCQKYSGC